MFYTNENDLSSAGVFLVVESDVHDTVSDESDWVRQYRDWTDDEIRIVKPEKSERNQA